ncbi:hypothetical protein [Micromonospora sp. CB01531]|uniref:hypothetical protein n=1 Tax=Micromonospora sp. CB01531 TaxID=1718947 RepID=UPI0011613533|nr:hypothetical protein [Micromonospora sp. CB01531]
MSLRVVRTDGMQTVGLTRLVGAACGVVEPVDEDAALGAARAFAGSRRLPPAIARRRAWLAASAESGVSNVAACSQSTGSRRCR